MRILDDDNDRPIKHVMVFLTIQEAQSLYQQLGVLISKRETHHIHVEDDDNKREMTIAIYSLSNISQFDEQSRKLIEENE